MSFSKPRDLLIWAVFVATGTTMISPIQADDLAPPPNGIDHILYASSSLQRGMDEIEALLGVRPVPGGNHPQYGTHNALLSLGSGVYLEVIARDPDLPAPQRGALVDIPPDSDSRLITWVFRAEDIQRLAQAELSAGFGLGPVESGNRIRPDGSQIHWRLTDPYAMPMDGAIPFLINWGKTGHPSLVLPSGGQLLELVIEHPRPDEVRQALSILAADPEVVLGERFRLSAKIKVENGIRTLH